MQEIWRILPEFSTMLSTKKYKNVYFSISYQKQLMRNDQMKASFFCQKILSVLFIEV
jgi:hypothetical protein